MEAALSRWPQYIIETQIYGKRFSAQDAINHITGLGCSGEAGERMPSPVDQTANSILDLAVILPIMKRLGDALA